MTENHSSNPQPGLYDPAQEHDACGVGFVVNINGEKSHEILQWGLEILVNLSHRGACGCDPLTGDGCGILTQMPHDFLQAVTGELGIALPACGEYGAGAVFLPRDEVQREFCQQRLEQIIAEEGQQLLGWRDVPVDNRVLGWLARDVEPVVRQIFIARGPDTSPDMLKWKLYVIRKRIERVVRTSRLTERKFFYLPSLSSRVLIYKGLMLPDQAQGYYLDLQDSRFVSALALVHQRYSTNTFPTWDLAHPFRFLAHNGEINTLRGNVNWMHAREGMLASEKYGPDLHKIMPICTPGASDSAIFDNALELLVLTGRSLPEAMSMLIPEPWAGHESMSDEVKAYYEYQSCLLEPWDGPASMAFTDGTMIGACLDRNGLRPSRYWVTKAGYVVLASESGVLSIPSDRVEYKGRLRPGRMFLVDTAQKRIIADKEIKNGLAARQPYRKWLSENMVKLADLVEGQGAPEQGAAEQGPGARRQGSGDTGDRSGSPHAEASNGHANGCHDRPLTKLQRTFGYTLEDLRILIGPMATDGQEAVGSMGNDTPLAVLSDRPQLLYNYFKQLFAQVTNPPLDAIREEIITSLITTIGSEGNLLDETPAQCGLLRLEQPILTDAELAIIKQLGGAGARGSAGARGEGRGASEEGADGGGSGAMPTALRGHEEATASSPLAPRPSPLACRTLSILFPRAEGVEGMRGRLEELRVEASRAIDEGATILILSDRGVDADRVPIPALLATSAVHHHLIRQETRTRCGLVVETGEAREVHHFALLASYGAGAINPYLALATLDQMHDDGLLPREIPREKLHKNYVKAAAKGILKVISKMGISTLQSYRGAQIFEAIGLSSRLVDEYFTRTPSRLEGIDLEGVAEESLRRHEHAYPRVAVPETLDLDVGGQYQWRRKGEAHMLNPEVVAKLQQATQINSREDFKTYCRLIDEQNARLLTLRGLLEFKWAENAIPLEEVEPAAEIVKRFATGAMSYGSISKEAHETLAIAMNRIGGKSNTGEGGEDPARYVNDANGDRRNSAVKQVASGRFGVTSLYLVNAAELQIKMAQGAKPGEGGQLPGHKVDREIARIRHSTPGVGLISPPPHHDIYSIEDLAQLIHDLKNSNSKARISVKLVAEVGVGTVAAGVAKGKADVVLISGHDGGTGASPLTSIKHAGLPWELGLAETHQVLVKNDLRSRIVVQTDGMLRTGKDVAIAALLGAEEWGIATAALVTLGCIMMRKCHLNTCPVGIATQDPVLRKKFTGKPESVVNFFFLLAEELRQIMARLGFRTINEMVGRVDRLDVRRAVAHWKAAGLDLSKILYQPEIPPHVKTYCCQGQDHQLEGSLDVATLVPLCQLSLEDQTPIVAHLPIRNVHRTVGTILSSEVTRRFGAGGFTRDDTIQLNFTGSAGQSLMAFGVHGITVRVEGDVNDYLGKGLSGGRIIVYPPREATFKAEQNIIAGNVVLYGATSGEVFIRGIAGERFCVRNSGASAVVEGIGDHGCEYMTGGQAIILGDTGRNFAAGMSGGVAYVLDEHGRFPPLVNREMVHLESPDAAELDSIREMIRRHVEYTGSDRGQYVLDHWDRLAERFVKVMPIDYKRALAELQRAMEETARIADAGYDNGAGGNGENGSTGNGDHAASAAASGMGPADGRAAAVGFDVQVRG